MLVEVIKPFAKPHLQPFRLGERFQCSEKEARELLDGKLVKPIATQPEQATAPKAKR